MSNHTPGPWKINQAGGVSVVWPDSARLAPIPIEHFAVRENGQPKLFLDCNRELLVESQANAALIASAPDLLAAAKSMIEHLDAGRVEHRWTAKDSICPGEIAHCHALRAAIARAEGKGDK